MPLPPFRHAAALVLTTIVPVAAHAQAAAPRDTAVHQVAPVTVKAPRPSATPGGASAIEASLDSNLVRPAPTLEQVLRTLPLVVVRANSRGEVQPALRGGEDRQIAVLVDGVPITLAWDHRTDLSVVPVTGARSLTLHRGLSTLLTGPNALAGAVDVDIASGSGADVAPPPFVLDAGVDHTGAHSAALSGGTLSPSAGGGHWLLKGGGGYRGSDGFVLARPLLGSDPATRSRLTADGDLRLNTDHETFDGFVSLRRVGAGGAWASLTGAGYKVERGVAPEAHTEAPRLWRYPFQARGLGVLSAGTGMRVTPWGHGDLEASFGADVSRTEIDEYDAPDYRTVVGGEDDDDHALTGRVLGDHTLGERGDLRLALTYADVSHDEVIGTDPPASYRQRLWSLASETDWRLTLGVPLRLSVGAAADGADTPESADKPPLARLWEWGGRAGATAVFREGALLVHGSTGRRARFPALRELYSGALGRFLANPDLRPETQHAHELGITTRTGRRELQLVGFLQRLDDAIVRISVPRPGGGSSLLQRVNLGRVDGRGVELVGSFGTGPLSLGADATFQRVRGRGPGGEELELEYEPDVYGGIRAETLLPAELRLGLEAEGMGEQRYLDLDTGALSTLAPSVRFDLRLSRSFAIAGPGPWQRVDATVALENVGDMPVFDQAGLPQPGRTFRIQARFW
jgi:iron complex outermembrane receptor protein